MPSLVKDSFFSVSSSYISLEALTGKDVLDVAKRCCFSFLDYGIRHTMQEVSFSRETVYGNASSFIRSVGLR